MNKLFNRKKKLGFTLTELIIVIAILAILAAVLVPLMVGYLNDAKISVANANARTLYSSTAAALTMAIANGEDHESIAWTTTETALASTDYFTQKIASLLGDNFKGAWKVDMGGTENDVEIVQVDWQEELNKGQIGGYPTVASSTDFAG